MIKDPIYQAAKTVAQSIEEIFRRHHTLGQAQQFEDLAVVPSSSVIEELISIAFWTSLRKEEGVTPKISLAYLSPDSVKQPLIFEKRIPLSPGTLTKIAPGFERAGIHLGIWREGQELFVWGATYQLPNLCFVIDVSEPGLIVVKHRRLNGVGKFANVAVLHGDEFKILDEGNTSSQDLPEALHLLLDYTSTTPIKTNLNLLLQLAVSIRAHHRGGTVLIVPSESEAWRESIRHPLHFAVSPTFDGVTRLASRSRESAEVTQGAGAGKEIEILAGLTAIDGAVVINDQFELLAFGEKIKRRDGNPSVEAIESIEPVMGGEAIVIDPAMHGGTRHLSAAQFVHDQHAGIALVASQDGRFTIFTWSEKSQIVQAHRIDSMLL